MAIEPDNNNDDLGADDAPESDPTDVATESGAYEVDSDDRTWGVLVHAAAFVGFVVPFGNVLGPLVVWAIKKDSSRFVEENGRQAVNFQLTWTILLIFALLSLLVLVGFALVPIVAIAWMILVVVAIVRASDDRVYEYPLTIEFISAPDHRTERQQE